jgi:hypothetical protein
MVGFFSVGILPVGILPVGILLCFLVGLFWSANSGWLFAGGLLT